MRERDIIRRLRDAFGKWGIGDDAAVLAPSGGDLLFASDAVVEGVHFRREYGTLGQAVQKVITSNVSDIYAMGGVPHAIVVTAGLPPGCGESDIDEIIEGAALACEAYGVRLVGGDTVRSPGGFFFDVAITGSVGRGRAVRRSGAQPGDALVLFGSCGGSRGGMLLLEALAGGARDTVLGRAASVVDADKRVAMMRIVSSLTLSMASEDMERLCSEHGLGPDLVPLLELAARHIVPLTRTADHTLLDADRSAADARYVSAMIDISDGLARDLATLCAESGVGAFVEEAKLPIHPALERVWRSEGIESADEIGSPHAADDDGYLPAVETIPGRTKLALSSGEEYVMLTAVRGYTAGMKLPGSGTVIGRIVKREEGVMLVTPAGDRCPLPELGYEHEF